MADERLTVQTEITTPASGDFLHIVDVSDTTEHATGTSKKIQYSNLTKKRFVELLDVSDDDYLGKVGYVPMVVGQGGPPYGYLKLTKLPDFGNIYGGSGFINYSIAHIGGLTYHFSFNGIIVNGIYYDATLSAVLTLNDGDATHPRIDVIVVTLTDPIAETFAYSIIEGTPAASPVKPVVNLENQVEFTFRTVAAGETTDPNAATELVYNENTGESSEWDNSFLLTDGELDATDDPFLDTYYIKVLDGTLPADPRVVFDNDSSIDFTLDKKLVFAMKTAGTWDYYASVQIKLIDITSGQYAVLKLTSQNLLNYGFSNDGTGWQVVTIPFSDFILQNPAFTDFDRIEFKADVLVYLDLDWINFQWALPPDPTPTTTTETKPTNVNTEGLTVIPLTNHEAYIGSASSPTTGNSFTLSTTKVLGAKAFLYVDTTGDSAFPTITGTRLMDGSYFEAGQIFEGKIFWDGTNANLTWKKVGQQSRKVEFIVACSDETTDLTTGTAKVTFRMPYAMTLQEVRAGVNVAPTGSTLIVDINESGTTILSTKLSIDASEKTSTTATAPAVISDATLADDAEITIDIDQIGSTVAGRGLKVTLKGITT